MSIQQTLAQTTSWRQLLLEDKISEELAEVLPDFLKQVGQAFLDETPTEVSAEESAELDRWYHSDDGQSELCRFLADLWDQMSVRKAFAMPAHDARHAMFKVPAAALQHMDSEKVQGWERIGLLGAVLHDHGRWAEERIFGGPRVSLVHARLSFLLGQELLSARSMPETIKRHILLAAVRHTTGARLEDPMPLKLTVAADRDQLYGPEIILRLAHSVANEAGDGSSYYGETPGKSVLADLARLAFCRLPGPLFARQEHIDHLWKILINFLLLAEGPDESKERFSQVSARDLEKTGFVWESAWEEAQREGRANVSSEWGVSPAPYAALAQLLRAPNIAPNPCYIQSALYKLTHLSPDRGPRLAAALIYANKQRILEDARQLDALKTIALANAQDELVQQLTRRLVAGWEG